MSSRAFIELGSNIDPERHLPRAVRALNKLGHVAAVSGVYETEPVGPPGQPDFLNAAVELETELSPHELRAKLRKAEVQLGRDRSGARYAPRKIDLDLCLYDDLVLDDGIVKLPHPDILERAYLARTLADVDPQLRHPTSRERMDRLAERLMGTTEPRARPDVREAMLAALENRA